MRTLSIVIPCYNEERTIREILRRVFAVSVSGWQMEVVIVDDDSKDGTRQILSEYEDQAKIIYRESNGGKGSAVKDGLKEASGDFVIIQDADLEYNPNEIPSLIKAIDNDNSVVYGSRNITRRKRTGYVIPRLGVWFITKLINFLYGVKLTDVWTCYKLFPSKFKYLFSAGRFDSEIVFTLRVLRAGYEIIEVPIGHAPRDVSEGKKIRYRDGFYAIAMIFKHWLTTYDLPRFKRDLRMANRGLVITMSVSTVFLLLFLCFIKPTIQPESDAPSYIVAMDVLQGINTPENFIPYRIVTTIGGLSIVIALSKVFGSYESAWLIMNMCFYLLAVGTFYKLILRLQNDPRVATVSALFLAGSYSMIIFGPNYFMDVGGWFFYILTAYLVLCYSRSKQTKYLWLAAVAAGLGGLFKEYALLGSFAIGFYAIYESWPSVKTFLKNIWVPALIVAIPIVILHFAVYQAYGYTYFDWLGNNQTTYIYSSRIIEYIKTIGSLLNILAILAMVGLAYFWKSRNQDKKDTAFVIAYFLSTVPILFWPAITQRITFVFVPISVILASYVFKRFANRIWIFIPILIVFVMFSFFMDSFILNFVNLPF